MSEATNGTAIGSGFSSLFGRAETLLGGLGTRLKDVRANFLDAPVTATEAPFCDASAPTVAQAEAQMRPATERAEETLDQIGERLGVFAAALGHRLRKAAALAREEAEDILAEAQTLRRNDAA
ncbi:MAG: hypothetical protein M3Y13_02160 [Armatimonadota bacterium]|nr:hypothetical protein [Armatimonadota bacterium]